MFCTTAPWINFNVVVAWNSGNFDFLLGWCLQQMSEISDRSPADYPCTWYSHFKLYWKPTKGATLLKRQVATNMHLLWSSCAQSSAFLLHCHTAHEGGTWSVFSFLPQRVHRLGDEGNLHYAPTNSISNKLTSSTIYLVSCGQTQSRGEDLVHCLTQICSALGLA